MGRVTRMAGEGLLDFQKHTSVGGGRVSHLGQRCNLHTYVSSPVVFPPSAADFVRFYWGLAAGYLAGRAAMGSWQLAWQTNLVVDIAPTTMMQCLRPLRWARGTQLNKTRTRKLNYLDHGRFQDFTSSHADTLPGRPVDSNAQLMHVQSEFNPVCQLVTRSRQTQSDARLLSNGPMLNGPRPMHGIFRLIITIWLRCKSM